MGKTIGERLGARIADIRKKRQINQAHLAELIDVAPETISRFERGVSIPSVKTLEKISTSLRAPLKDFFTFKTEAPTLSQERENELAKIMVLFKDKKKADIQLGHQVLKSLFSQLKNHYRAIKKG